MQEIKTICVCGAGTMGSGIAQVCAQAGYDTVLFDVSESMLAKAKSKLENDLEQLAARQKITETEKSSALQKIIFTNNPSLCVADIIIEAIVEKMEAKLSLFRQLEALNGAQTILATNTSSLPVAAIAAGLTRKERLIGLHFFNPAPLMKLVEVIKTPLTEDKVLATGISFIRSLSKTPVLCKDAPGFIVNRVARPFYIESLRLAEEGLDIQLIDRLVEARGFRMGPFKLMDLIGNDINYAVSCSVYNQLNMPDRLKPSYIQKDKVQAGELGKKTGRGYYEY